MPTLCFDAHSFAVGFVTNAALFGTRYNTQLWCYCRQGNSGSVHSQAGESNQNGCQCVVFAFTLPLAGEMTDEAVIVVLNVFMLLLDSLRARNVFLKEDAVTLILHSPNVRGLERSKWLYFSNKVKSYSHFL